jgi:hypothetical protein
MLCKANSKREEEESSIFSLQVLKEKKVVSRENVLEKLLKVNGI